MRPDQLERDRRYLATPRGRFKQAKARAKQRGVTWRLTFDQWWDIWTKSGRWELRGGRKGNYCMARLGDVGAYEVGNVEIVPCRVNIADRNVSQAGHHHRRSDAGIKRRHTRKTTSVAFND